MIEIKPLPPKGDLETKAVLKKLTIAHRSLAELKGLAASIPNQQILIDTLSLQEARESSAIENIISTFSEVYQSDWKTKNFASPQAKEVHAYAAALKMGFGLVRNNKLLTTNHILKIQQLLEQNNAGLRKLPGTVLKNDRTGEVIYTPPQDYNTIVSLMDNLNKFINDDSFYNADYLVKMAIIHHQLESIHPFYDGNGRTGRIINILYLIKNDLLLLPILYLSRYITKHKQKYYQLLQSVRVKKDWESWILFMLDSISVTASETIVLVTRIREEMYETKLLIRGKEPKLYSQDLINNLFKYPYTKIEYLMSDLSISRNTAIRYTDKLIDLGLLMKKKIGRENFYVNKALSEILINPFDK